VNYKTIFRSLSNILRIESNFEELLSNLIRLMVASIPPADAGIIYLYNDKNQTLVSEASYGHSAENVKHSLDLKEGAIGQCYSSCKSLCFSSVEAVMEQATTLKTQSLGCYSRMRRGMPPALSMVTIPVIIRNKKLGVILLEQYKRHRSFEDRDLLELEVLSGWLSLLIDDLQSHLELKHSKRSYRELLGKFITTSEEERKTIAREIHDEVNQLLLSVMLNLEDVESTLPADLLETRERLQVSRSHINKVFDGLHDLSLRLRPPALDDLGLRQALDWYINNLSKEADLPITLRVSGSSRRRPAPVVETELFRIAQEALSNVIKHAKASSATVQLDFGESRLVLLVRDNGTGFDADALLSDSDYKHSLGLLGMIERTNRCGGALKIDSSSGRGTRLRIEIPIQTYDWGAY